jgi:hypothetical protein
MVDILTAQITHKSEGSGGIDSGASMPKHRQYLKELHGLKNYSLCNLALISLKFATTSTAFAFKPTTPETFIIYGAF